MNDEQLRRFWSKVDKSKGDDTCWEWQGLRTSRGYGHLTLNYKSLYAHRVSWSLVNGEIPEGMCVCHRCDNPSCVNPSHMFIGTMADNIRDRDEKGRHPVPMGMKGENNPSSRLTVEDVQTIRRLYAARELNQRQIGERYGLPQQYVSKIVNRKQWKDC